MKFWIKFKKLKRYNQCRFIVLWKITNKRDDSQIQSLPNNLKVEDDLHISNTPIKSLPNGLKVGGILFLGDTPLSKKYTEEEIKAMVPGVKGKIYL